MSENKRQKAKIYNRYNAPNGRKAEAGKEIYTYSYKNEDGEMIEKSINIQEKIQSQAYKVDYKRMIREGTLEDARNGSYGDYTELQLDDTADSILLSEFIGSLSQDEVRTILEQRTQNNLETTTSEEMVQQTNEETGKETASDTQTTNNSTGGGE